MKNAILTRWRAVCESRRDAPAVLAADGRVLLTFEELNRRAEEIGFPGLQPGEVAGLQIGNHPEWPAFLLAMFRAQLIPLPLGRHMDQVERDRALQVCGASALISIDSEGGVLTERLPDVPQERPAGDFLKVTSGTTSAPRSICFTAEQLVADCDNVCETMGISDGDLNYGVVPFSHSYGFSNLITPLLCRGIPLVASEDRMPRAILNGLAASRATVFPGMPVFYSKFAGLENTPALPHLRLCISAGAPLTAQVASPFTWQFGVKIHTFYGSSECGGIAYDASSDTEYEDDFVGTPMRNVSVTPTTEGRIEVRSAAVGLGYFPENDPAVLADGCFTPADLTRFSDRGLHLIGRTSDVINIAGRKLNPLEIEAQLLQIVGVSHATVFGVTSSLRNEEAVACVVADPVMTATAILAECRARLSSWQVPRDIWLVPEIPVNEGGKISRPALAQRYLASRAASC